MEMPFAITVFEKTRASVLRAVDGLTTEQMLAVPTGFANNIAWNIGHMIVIQQVFVYGRCGLDLAVSAETLTPLYWANTAPSDWPNPPNVDELKGMLVAHAEMLSADYAAGKFENVTFEPRTSGSGITMDNVMDAIHYNNYHEGLHSGTILSLKDFV